MQSTTQFGDQLRFQVNTIKPLLIAVLVGLLILLVGLRLMPEASTPLLAKVMGLLSPTIATAAVGAYYGRRLRGLLAMLGLFAVSIIGMFIIRSLGGSDLAIVLLMGWGFVNGMMLGPLVGFALAEAGPGIIIESLTGTTAVMLGAAFISLATGIDFSFLMPVLFLGLIGLIIVGLIGIFVRFSRTVNLARSVIGMVLFAGYFLFDFFRLGRSENAWDRAVQLTISLYLDFANFFIFLLQFLLNSRRR
ncbi:MAG TPA: Bax inhibitor-1 family protein [Blastocatellia bacterium]|nr:Bax inhibitor-1 family protein [Blastocatellia bacterium]